VSYIYLLTISGYNRPGLCSQITHILADCQVDILDIGQSVIHDTLSLGMLVATQSEPDLVVVQQRLDELLSACDARLRVRPVAHEDYESWVAGHGQPKHVITLLSRKMAAKNIQAVSAVLAQHGLDIYHVRRLTGRVPIQAIAQQNQACVEFIARGSVRSVEGLRKELMVLGSGLDADIAYQEDNIHRRHRRLVAFDMDSTLIQEEVIDELAKRAGAGDRVSKITEAAMRGDIDFKESLRQRVASLEGLPETVLAEIAENLRLNEGADRLMAGLSRMGLKTVILSGGFTYFGRYLSSKLGIDFVHANNLEIIDGKMTGRVLGDIVDGERKAALLREIAAQQGFGLEQTIAVGDGANDLPMLSVAGMGIAFHAKPVVQASASYPLSNLGLDAILYLMGVSAFGCIETASLIPKLAVY